MAKKTDTPTHTASALVNVEVLRALPHAVATLPVVTAWRVFQLTAASRPV